MVSSAKGIFGSPVKYWTGRFSSSHGSARHEGDANVCSQTAVVCSMKLLVMDVLPGADDDDGPGMASPVGCLVMWLSTSEA